MNNALLHPPSAGCGALENQLILHAAIGHYALAVRLCSGLPRLCMRTMPGTYITDFVVLRPNKPSKPTLPTFLLSYLYASTRPRSCLAVNLGLLRVLPGHPHRAA